MAVRTLGCARNEVDSEELAARLADAGWATAAEDDDPDVVLINTCGFIEQAKRESIDAILEATEGSAPVVAVGCLAQRYGTDLARELPEAVVLGFDDYPDIGARLDDVVAGSRPSAPVPGDRRLLHAAAPADRQVIAGPILGVRRIAPGPIVPVKLANGCDRRCTFCAIPTFRGSFASRRPTDVLDEVRQLAAGGVREVVLVSENSTSYGKDLGDLDLLPSLLRELGAVEGLERVRVSYLQPAELRPALLDALCDTPGVARYFDLSFQHASPGVLRRMRRFGGAEEFLHLLDRIRRKAPTAGVRSNVIVGFPGETEEDVDLLCDFLGSAGMDAVGVFGYSDEEGTEAVALPDHLPEDEVRARVEHVASCIDELMVQRAADRVGEHVRVIVDDDAGGQPEGKAEHQGPEDGCTRLDGPTSVAGRVASAIVIAADGVDLVARVQQ